MRIEAYFCRESAELEAVATTCVQHHVARGWFQEVGDAAEDCGGDAAIMEASSGGTSGGGISGFAGTSILGLKQVDIAAAGKVKGMSTGAKQATLVAIQGQLAAADRTEEHMDEFSE